MAQHYDDSATAVFDASGVAVASLTVPTRPPSRVLIVEHVAVSTSLGRSAEKAKAAIYRGGVDPATFMAASDKGGGDSATSSRPFWPGENIVCEWTGGTAGQTATMRVEGSLMPANEYSRES